MQTSSGGSASCTPGGSQPIGSLRLPLDLLDPPLIPVDFFKFNISDSVAVFKFRLKTFLFYQAFSSSSAH